LDFSPLIRRLRALTADREFRTWFRRIGLLLAIPACLFVLALAWSWLTLPPLERLERMEPSLITRMFDKDSNVLREYYVERRVWTPLERVPPRQIQAVLAIEDRDFWTHGGVDLPAIGASLLSAVSVTEFMVETSTATYLPRSDSAATASIVESFATMAQTLADSMLLHVSRKAVFDEIERSADFARRMLAGLSRRLHSLISDVESYSMQSGTERVIGYLLRQDEELAAANSAYVMRLTTSKAVVASRLNVTPEHFSRILHDLTEQKLIEVEGREIRIVDPARLRAFHG